jgi:hypothetical protein
MGGNSHQLIIQIISATFVTIWGAFATLFMIWFVDLTLKVRLTPEEEMIGCDYTEHNIGENPDKTLQRRRPSTLDKINERIIEIATPIAQRFAGNIDPILKKEEEHFGKRKAFHTNQGFEAERY